MKNKEQHWKGYTMQELQMHRAINSVRLEIEKEKLTARFDGLRATATGTITSFLLSHFGSLSRAIGLITTGIGIARKVYTLLRR